MQLNRIWDGLNSLEQIAYGEFLQSPLYKRILAEEIKVIYDQLGSIDPASDDKNLGQQYKVLRSQLDFYRQMLLFINNLVFKPVDEGE